MRIQFVMAAAVVSFACNKSESGAIHPTPGPQGPVAPAKIPMPLGAEN
ncbi:hypothetical protein HNQ91_003887 [Filimonas zeae]|nr:hypothetical protein [Filimonas zeae]